MVQKYRRVLFGARHLLMRMSCWFHSLKVHSLLNNQKGVIQGFPFFNRSCMTFLTKVLSNWAGPCINLSVISRCHCWENHFQKPNGCTTFINVSVSLNTNIQYAPKSWTCQFRQLRGFASESQWQHHCIYLL